MPKRKIFVHKLQNAKVTQDDKGNSRFEEDIKTYEVKKSNKKFVVYEIDRKSKKQKKVKTIRQSKNLRTRDDVIKKFQSNEVRINTKYSTKFKDSEQVQTNYKPRRNDFQIIAIMRVEDTKRDITEFYTCFSHMTGVNERTKSIISYDQALNDLRNMAIAKFCKDFGNPTNTGDLYVTPTEIRYQYYKR